MKKVYSLLALVALISACGDDSEEKKSETPGVVAEVEQEVLAGQEAQDVQANQSGAPDFSSYECVEGKIKEGQFFSTLMNDLGLSMSDTYALIAACDSVFDVMSVRVGNAYRAYYAQEEQGRVLKYVAYDLNRTKSVLFQCSSPFKVTKQEKQIKRESKYADVTINTSLWVDMREAGASPALIMTLSDIYAWTIDFFGLQKGDRFRVLYDELQCDGQTVSVDTVRYALFSHGKQEYPLVMYNPKGGGNIYWNEKGESMRKAFLKAPLKFSRISSGFTYARKHPITRRVQPHTGVDYAAPLGTPVVTIGDGVVTSIKYEGAGGKVVRIKHNTTYSTAYLHLHDYAKGLTVGQRVKQGQVIGYVGSTGRSTGPHLDFRIWKNGKPINPLTMESPTAEPLSSSEMAKFKKVYEGYKAKIDVVKASDLATEIYNIL